MADNTIKSRPFRPSNGTVGEAFHEDFCYRCLHFEECDILPRTMLFGINEPEYPTEWIVDDAGARCTAFLLETDDPELAAARADPRQMLILAGDVVQNMRGKVARGEPLIRKHRTLAELRAKRRP